MHSSTVPGTGQVFSKREPAEDLLYSFPLCLTSEVAKSICLSTRSQINRALRLWCSLPCVLIPPRSLEHTHSPNVCWSLLYAEHCTRPGRPAFLNSELRPVGKLDNFRHGVQGEQYGCKSRAPSPHLPGAYSRCRDGRGLKK